MLCRCLEYMRMTGNDGGTAYHTRTIAVVNTAIGYACTRDGFGTPLYAVDLVYLPVQRDRELRSTTL